jgi:ribosomal protein S18 acetylase RimI-like enzyme
MGGSSPSTGCDPVANRTESGVAYGSGVGISISTASAVDDELVAAFERLIPQLSTSNPPPSRSALEEIVGDPGNVVFIARDDAADGRIVGTLTLATFRIPTAMRAWIEDVVADSAAAGQRIGELLSLAAIDEARRRGAKTVELTSRPSREAANHIYKKIGFSVRDTNVYRFTLE